MASFLDEWNKKQKNKALKGTGAQLGTDPGNNLSFIDLWSTRNDPKLRQRIQEHYQSQVHLQRAQQAAQESQQYAQEANSLPVRVTNKISDTISHFSPKDFAKELVHPVVDLVTPPKPTGRGEKILAAQNAAKNRPDAKQADELIKTADPSVRPKALDALSKGKSLDEVKSIIDEGNQKARKQISPTTKKVLGDTAAVASYLIAPERAALAGAVGGAGYTASDNPNASALEIARNAAIGAAGGKVLQLAGRGIKNIRGKSPATGKVLPENRQIPAETSPGAPVTPESRGLPQGNLPETNPNLGVPQGAGADPALLKALETVQKKITKAQQGAAIAPEEARTLMQERQRIIESIQTHARAKDTHGPTPGQAPEQPGAPPPTTSQPTEPPVAAGTTAPETPPATATTAPATPETGQDIINRANEALKSAPPFQRKQAAEISAERGKRFAKGAQARQGKTGEQAFYASKGAMQGAMSKTEFDGLQNVISNEDYQSLLTHIQHSPRLLEGEKLTAQTGLEKAYKGTVPTPGEIEQFRKVLGNDFTNNLVSKLPVTGQVKKTLLEVASIPRTVMASLDHSIPGRQAFLTIFSNPVLWTKNFVKSLTFLSEKQLIKAERAIEADPYYDLFVKSNTFHALRGSLRATEEPFLGAGLIEKFPLLGIPIRASERLATGFGNIQRFDMFKKLARSAENTGIDLNSDTKALRSMGDVINTLTGRGKSMPGIRKYATELNTVFFSPNLIASRLDMLNPAYYAKLHPLARQEALKALFGASAGAMMIMGAAAANGWKVDADPRSPDFGKIRHGNTRIDVTGGFGAYIRLAAQLATGVKTNTYTGETKPTGRGDVLTRFARSKLSPVGGMLADIYTGKDFVGNPVTVKGELSKIVVPLLYQDVKDVYNDNPDNILFAGAVFGASFLGAGVQTYGRETPGQLKYALGDNSSPDLVKAINDVSEKTGFRPSRPSKSVFVDGESKQLNKDEYQKYEKRSSELFSSQLADVINQQDYKNKSDDDKVKVLRKILTKARTDANKELFQK